MARKGKRQRQQRRAAKHARRHKRVAARQAERIMSPVLFDQDEAAAIAGMMSAGSQGFAGQFGQLLHDSIQLQTEPEFIDLQIDLSSLADGPVPPDQGRAALIRQLMQTSLRIELLARLDRFVERARPIAELHHRWLAAVALKFLLEQPPSHEQEEIWGTSSLISALLDQAVQRQNQ